jgi:hypothetical protein
VTPYAKAAKVSLDGSCVAFLRGGALRRSVIERGASSCLDALPQLGGRCVASVSGPTIPDSVGSVTSDHAYQASVAVLPMKKGDPCEVHLELTSSLGSPLESN